MPLSVVDIYRDILPKTNCGDCGFSTCLAFAGMVVSEKHALDNCPHLTPDVLERFGKELSNQYASGKWLKKDLAEEALLWARERSASMDIRDLPGRIGGELSDKSGDPVLKLPYFNGTIFIRTDSVTKADGSELTRWEQVFVYNHMAQGGASKPSGHWKGFVEFPNTVSKAKSMAEQVELPLQEAFRGRVAELAEAAARLGGVDMTSEFGSADLAIWFTPLPRVPLMLMFWDADQEDGFDAKAKLLFDETVTEHLDIESMVFLSERLRQLLCG